MNFQPEYAADTLRQVAGILVERQSEMDAQASAAVKTLVREYGPQIAVENPLNAGDRVGCLLDALWAARDRLPLAAVQMLQAGVARPDGLRRETCGLSLIRLSDAERVGLLQSLIQVEDFRVFANPRRLAEEVVELVKTHQNRLTAPERDAWRQLQAIYGRTGDAEAFLWGVQRLLGSYPRVSRLLELGKISAASLRMREGALRGPQGKGAGIVERIVSPAVSTRPARRKP